uniref:NADH dehydrogenase subunit 4L n=1 Tax=Posthodiplostomum centrarchi TaxID=1954244 RepID=A0A6J3YVB6_9TREM|nr:NADH dehydrogenase subunit 4L [Posthodiplostomum centrarchi]
MYSGLMLVCGSIILLSIILSANRLLNCLIVLENLNVLLLFLCLLNQVEEFRIIFISLMVIFTIEITLALVVLTRIWSLSSLVDIVGL